MQSTFQLSNLFPDFSAIFDGRFSTSAGISAFVVLILIVMAVGFFVHSLMKYYSSQKQISFYTDIISGVAEEDIQQKQREITQKAKGNTLYKDLWLEFDESLVRSNDGEKLYNTLDASHFFNTHTLARGLTENRLLAAVPGFLTAIGVIGTFAGLLMGLSGLSDMNSVGTDASIDDLKAGIFSMIGGASIAFMTSVWGVGTSVIFNFVEKLLERSIRGKITGLQNSIDYIYPRLTAESMLKNIEDFSKESTATLQGLAEKIGDKMQEALVQATSNISESLEESLHKVMKPALESLVNNAKSGSEQAMGALVENFMGGMSKAGQEQSEQLNNAAQSVQGAVDGFSSTIDSFVSDMNTRVETMNSNTTEFVSSMQSSLLSNLEAQKSANQESNDMFVENIQQAQSINKSFVEKIDSVMNRHNESQANNISGFKSLLEEFDRLSEANRQSSSSLQRAAENMHVSSNSLESLSKAISESVIELSQNLDEATNKVGEITIKSDQIASNLLEANSQFASITEQLSVTTERLTDISGRVDNGLTAVNQHFDSLMGKLTDHTDKLSEHVNSLLQVFAENTNAQISERMKVWNQHTSEYVSQMTNAVNAISDVVDEIETKVGSAV